MEIAFEARECPNCGVAGLHYCGGVSPDMAWDSLLMAIDHHGADSPKAAEARAAFYDATRRAADGVRHGS